MNTIADDMAVLHRHEVDRVIARAGDVAILNIHMLRLVDLEVIVGQVIIRVVAGRAGDVEAAVEAHATHQEVIAALAVQRVAGDDRLAGWKRLDIQIDQIDIVAIGDIEIAAQDRRAGAVGGLKDDRELHRAEA